MITGPWIAFAFFALITIGAMILIPVLLVIVAAVFGVVGIVVSLFTREKWK